MANHFIQGFANVRERVAFENALIAAQKKMPEILKDARNNESTKATRAYSLWFGKINRTRMERVIGVLSMMDMALRSSGITFVRQIGGNPRECAATDPPYGVWGDQSPRQVAQSAHQHQEAYRMAIGDNFYLADNSLDRTVESAQFNTMCHELSHLVGDTVDTVYGSVKSRILARENPDAAINCAENYGFYCEELAY